LDLSVIKVDLEAISPQPRWAEGRLRVSKNQEWLKMLEGRLANESGTMLYICSVFIAVGGRENLAF
jgi:hypothetical protein